MSKFKSVGAILMLLSLLSCYILISCEKERNGYSAPNGGAHFSLNWSRIWFWQPKPQTVKMLLFPQSGSENQTGEISAEGGTLPTLPVNEYQYIALSGNLTDKFYRGLGNYATAEIYLQERTDREGVTLVYPPLLLYGSSGQLSVKPERLSETEVQPVSLVKSLSFRVKIIGNDRVEKCTARLSGVAKGVRLSSRIPVDCTASTDFELSKPISDFTGQVYVFGFNTTDKSAMLSITCTSGDSRKTVTVDLTDRIELFHTDALSCTIEINYDNPDTGLTPSVTITDWQVGNFGNIELE